MTKVIQPSEKLVVNMAEEEPDKKSRTAEKWKYFRESSTNKRKKLLNHTFAFRIDDIGSGWEYIHFELDGRNVCNCRVSYIGPDVHAFVRTVIDMEEKDFVEIVFLDEPGEYRLLMSRRKDKIYVELPDMEDGFFMKYEDFAGQIMEEFHKYYRY